MLARKSLAGVRCYAPANSTELVSERVRRDVVCSSRHCDCEYVRSRMS